MSKDEFLEALLLVAPGFQPCLNEHREYYGEVLDHVLMGDFTRWYIDRFREARLRGTSDLAAVNAFLEDSFERGDYELQELISASFLENLHQADEDYAALKPTLPQVLLEQLIRVE